MSDETMRAMLRMAQEVGGYEPQRELRAEGYAADKAKGPLSQALEAMGRSHPPLGPGDGILPMPSRIGGYMERLDPAEARELALAAVTLLGASVGPATELVGEVAELMLKRAKALLGGGA